MDFIQVQNLCRENTNSIISPSLGREVKKNFCREIYKQQQQPAEGGISNRKVIGVFKGETSLGGRNLRVFCDFF